jgi:basic amino acid/polyamine antiporter, APA family
MTLLERSASPKVHVTVIPFENGVTKSSSELRRILGLWDLIFIIVGTVIGSGIFLVPGAVLRAVGNSVPMAMSVWLVGGILTLLGALTYGELSAMQPRAGGLYIFIRDCYGPLPAFLFGWTLLFVISSGSIATLAVAFSNYLGEFLQLQPLELKGVAIVSIAIITAVNVLGTRKSMNLVRTMTAIKAAAIVVFSVFLLWQGKHTLFNKDTLGGVHASSGIAGFGMAMISVLWAYEGWQYATYCAGETVNSQKTFPVAFLAGTITLIALYLAANAGYLAALGEMGVAESNRVAAAALGEVAGEKAGKIVAIAILISIFSAANAIALNAPRVCYAMAKDGLFFQRFCEIHPRFGTPALAVGAVGVWSAILAASGTFDQLLTYVVFIGWIFYALAAGSVFIYRKRQPDAARPYRVPAYPWTPALFVAAALGLVANTIVREPIRAAVGLGIVLLGAPAYFFWKRKGRQAVEGATDV